MELHRSILSETLDVILNEAGIPELTSKELDTELEKRGKKGDNYIMCTSQQIDNKIISEKYLRVIFCNLLLFHIVYWYVSSICTRRNLFNR